MTSDGRTTSDLLDELQHSREKMREQAEGLSELSREIHEGNRRMEVAEEDKNKLSAQIVALTKERERLEQERAEKADEMENLKKAFEMLREGGTRSSAPSSQDGHHFSPDPRPEGHKDKSETMKGKLAKMEEQLTTLAGMYQTIVEQKNKSDRKAKQKDAQNVQLEHELNEAKQKYDKLLVMCEKLSQAMAEKKHAHPKNLKVADDQQDRAVPRKSVTMPRKSVIVKTLRGGVTFRCETEKEKEKS